MNGIFRMWRMSSEEQDRLIGKVVLALMTVRNKRVQEWISLLKAPSKALVQDSRLAPCAPAKDPQADSEHEQP